MKEIFVQPKDGLANRMRTIVGAISLAKKIKRTRLPCVPGQAKAPGGSLRPMHGSYSIQGCN